MKRATTLWCVLLLGATWLGCRDESTWRGSVDPWAIPQAGNNSVPFRGGDYGGDGDVSWQAQDAGMDAQLPDYDPALSHFDARQVYLMGTLSQGLCVRGAIAPVLEPNNAVIGFGCYASGESAQIRPTDGCLFYTEQGVIYLFSADLGNEQASAANYPRDPRANDLVIQTPMCSEQYTSNSFRAFKLSASGEFFYGCGTDWYDADDTLVATLSDSVLQVGTDGSALTEIGVHPFASTASEAEDASVADAGDASALAGDAGTSSPVERSLRPFVGLPEGTFPRIVTSRTRPDGYWIVLSASGSSETFELWHVDFSAHASKLGTYPAPPEKQQVQVGGRLDSDGALYQMAYDTSASFRDTIVRRTVQGESSVVYDEATDPLVKIHISSLITGP